MKQQCILLGETLRPECLLVFVMKRCLLPFSSYLRYFCPPIEKYQMHVTFKKKKIIIIQNIAQLTAHVRIFP